MQQQKRPARSLRKDTMSSIRSMSCYRAERQVNDMLALSRKKGEALVINNNIEVTVLEVKGDQVKIGISAPKEVPIYRKEVYLQIQDSNKEAMQADLEALKKLF